MHEKIITAICRTKDGIEWSSLKVKSDGTTQLTKKSAPMDFIGTEELITFTELPQDLAEQIKGDIVAPLRTSELLMRVIELPSIADDEITDMVEFQIDKISPFPIDLTAISHEILEQQDETSLVLMVYAKRSYIDFIGDTFEKKDIHIHSMDSRLLGWMQLLRDDGHISEENCEILIIDDEVDFSLVITNSGIPVAFRMLHAQADNINVVDELADEIEYTLTTLDIERDLATPSLIQYWDHEDSSSSMHALLSEKCGFEIYHHTLNTLPPLSEGIVRRALVKENHIELIPREWIEYKKQTQLKKKSLISVSAITGIWLIILLGLFTVHKAREMKLAKTKDRTASIAPAAKQALNNRQKLNTLKTYTDRSDSALECLREATLMLPDGDIEFLDYKYTKGKGVTLRGTARNDDIVNDYFIKLSKSSLFEKLNNQSSRPHIKRGVRRQLFSVTLALPSDGDEK